MLYAWYQFAKNQNTPDTINSFPDDSKGSAEHFRVAAQAFRAQVPLEKSFEIVQINCSLSSRFFDLTFESQSRSHLPPGLRWWQQEIPCFSHVQDGMRVFHSFSSGLLLSHPHKSLFLTRTCDYSQQDPGQGLHGSHPTCSVRCHCFVHPPEGSSSRKGQPPGAKLHTLLSKAGAMSPTWLLSSRNIAGVTCSNDKIWSCSTLRKYCRS